MPSQWAKSYWRGWRQKQPTFRKFELFVSASKRQCLASDELATGVWHRNASLSNYHLELAAVVGRRGNRSDLWTRNRRWRASTMGPWVLRRSNTSPRGIPPSYGRLLRRWRSRFDAKETSCNTSYPSRFEIDISPRFQASEGNCVLVKTARIIGHRCAANPWFSSLPKPFGTRSPTLILVGLKV